MAKNLDFPGGVGQIEIDDTGSFDDAAAEDPSTFVVTIGEDQIAAEGNEFPDPEAITSALANDKEFRMGLDQNVSIRASSMKMTDFDQLEDQVVDGAALFIRVTSAATYSDGSPKFQVVYKGVILSNATPSPVQISRDAYGGIVLAGKTTGYRSSDIMEVTKNSAPA